MRGKPIICTNLKSNGCSFRVVEKKKEIEWLYTLRGHLGQVDGKMKMIGQLLMSKMVQIH